MDDEITLLGRGGIASSMEHMNIKETVQMMPQDEHRSEFDLGFMTEVDAEYKGKGGRESQGTAIGEAVSTRMSEVEGNTSVPINRSSSMLEIEKAEFKQVIKELISKEQND